MPILSQVYQLPEINRDHPVIREMLVYYFSHLCVFLLKNSWTEPKQDKNILSLVGQGHGSMFRIRIGSQHFVNIIIFELVDEVFNHVSIDWEPAEIVNRVVLWDDLSLSLRIEKVPCVLAKLADFTDVV